MSGLPAIDEREIDGVPVRTVNLRDLHTELGVGRDFNTWVKDRIEKYGFVEHQDYEKYEDLSSPILGNAKARAQTLIEYAGTVDMAKELAMVENNDAGRRCRRHFIECERRLKDAERAMTPAEAFLEKAKMMVAVERRQIAIEAKQKEQDAAIKANAERLQQIETSCDHFTCVGYARWAKGMSIDLQTAADLGRRATRKAHHLGVKITKVPDPRFGAVSQYPKSILDEVWNECFPPLGGVQ